MKMTVVRCDICGARMLPEHGQFVYEIKSRLLSGEGTMHDWPPYVQGGIDASEVCGRCFEEIITSIKEIKKRRTEEDGN